MVVSIMCGYCSTPVWLMTVCISGVVTVATVQKVILRSCVLPSDALWEFWKKIRVPFGSYVRTYGDSRTRSNTTDGTSISPKKSIPGHILDSHCGNGIDIDTCLHFILRDFVLSWYQIISCNSQFSKEIHYLMEDLSVALTSRIRKVNKYKLAKNIVNAYHSYFVSYLSAVQSIQKQHMNKTLLECLDKEEIEKRFTSYHVAMTSAETETHYLNYIANTLLEVLTPVDLLTCKLARKLVVEILVKNVMIPLMDSLSDPDWTNQKMISILSDDEPVDNKCQANHVQVVDSVDQLGSLLSSMKVVEEEMATCDDNSTTTCDRESIYTVGDNGNCDMQTETLRTNRQLNFEEDTRVPDASSKSVCDTPLTECKPNKSRLSSLELKQTSTTGSLSSDRTVNTIEPKLPFLPTSKSLEHISSVVINTLGELERPIEYITGNLAHYFRVANDEPDENNSECRCSESGEEVKRRNSAVWLRETISNSIPVQVLGQRRCSASDVMIKGHSISLALQGAISTTTGLILSDRLKNLDFQSTPSSETPDLPLPPEPEGVLFTVKGTAKQSSSTDFKNTEPFISFPKFNLNLRSPCTPTSKTESESDLPSPSRIGFASSLDGESALEAVEMSPDNRCFMNLFIPCTEIVEEAGGGGLYALYCIEYEAWYLDPSSIETIESDSFVDISEPRMVLQGTQVKRRFREFRTLQDRLDKNASLRPYLQNIQKPSKWLELPFGKTDKETIEERRVFLEKYLCELVRKEEIAASPELREFLAYGSDASIAYVKKVPESMVPRIDKFIVKKVSGMFEKLRTALPTLPLEATSPIDSAAQMNKSSERRGFLGFQFGNSDDTRSVKLEFGFIEREPGVLFIEDQLRRYISESQYGDNVDALFGGDSKFVEPPDIPSPQSPDGPPSPAFSFETTSSGGHELSSSDEVDTTQQNNVFCYSKYMQTVDKDVPLTSSVLNLALEGLQNKDLLVNKDKFLYGTKQLVGKFLEYWLCDKLDECTTWGMCIKYLRQVRDAVWPGGVLPMDPEPNRTSQEKLETLEKGLACLKEFFSGAFLPFLVSSDAYDECMALFFDSLQHPRLLRHLMYNLLDLVVDALARETQCPSFQEKFAHIAA